MQVQGLCSMRPAHPCGVNITRDFIRRINITRGNLEGRVAGIKAHLECKGLILNDGLMQTIPELTGHVPGVEMPHEAAVDKIDQHEIEYLMARGLDEDEVISTIVRGFLNVDIEGLPAGLKKKLDRAVSETQKDMM